MSLNLDQRQRAMLQEMRVRVWAPMPAAPADGVPVALAPAAAVPAPVAAQVPLADARRAAAPAHVAASAVQSPPGRAAEAQPVALRGQPSVPVQPAPSVHGMDMAQLASTIASCSACQLCEGRKAPVFAMQAVQRQADWLVVGDPPTDDDERAGAAFAGQAGELLDNMLRAVHCQRDGVGAAGAWLTSVVKCRPAVVRNPQADELARCAEYLRREVALVQPRVILAMGRFAALSLLVDTDPEVAKIPFGKLRGQVFAFEGVPVVVTYSPARLLRAQEDKAGAWADLCLARVTAQRAAAPATENQPHPEAKPSP